MQRCSGVATVGGLCRRAYSFLLARENPACSYGCLRVVGATAVAAAATHTGMIAVTLMRRNVTMIVEASSITVATSVPNGCRIFHARPVSIAAGLANVRMDRGLPTGTITIARELSHISTIDLTTTVAVAC